MFFLRQVSPVGASPPSVLFLKRCYSHHFSRCDRLLPHESTFHHFSKSSGTIQLAGDWLVECCAGCDWYFFARTADNSFPVVIRRLFCPKFRTFLPLAGGAPTPGPVCNGLSGWQRVATQGQVLHLVADVEQLADHRVSDCGLPISEGDFTVNRNRGECVYLAFAYTFVIHWIHSALLMKQRMLMFFLSD